MPSLGGTFLKLLQTILYGIIFCCSGLILGIYSFFLSVLATSDVPIAQWKKAVEGLSGAAVVYMIFAVVLTCCLGGIRAFAFLAIILDVLFAGAMIAIAVLTRDGVDTCSGTVDTPLGSGPAKDTIGDSTNNYGLGGTTRNDYGPDLRFACRLNKVAFAVSIIAAALFLVCAGLQLVLARKHQKDKRYGPSPANGYTSGTSSKRRFWQRSPRTAPDAEVAYGDPKVSHETGYTHSTTPATATYDSAGRPTGGFHTGPGGSYAAPNHAQNY